MEDWAELRERSMKAFGLPGSIRRICQDLWRARAQRSRHIPPHSQTSSASSRSQAPAPVFPDIEVGHCSKQMLMLRNLPRGAIPAPTWRYHGPLDIRISKTFGVQALCLPCTVWAGQTAALLLGLINTESLRVWRVDAYQILTSSPLAFFSGAMATNRP